MKQQLKNHLVFLGWVLPEKLGESVLPTIENPCPIYDQNLQFSLPYLWPDQKFDTLFMTKTAEKPYPWEPMEGNPPPLVLQTT